MKNIFVLLTPLHLEIIKIISLEHNLNLNNSVVYYNQYVSKDTLTKLFGQDSTLINVPEGNISFKEFLIGPIKQLVHLRTLFNKFHNVLSNTLSSEASYNLYMGSDKDVFTQLLVTYLQPKGLNTVYAFDEGTGYYKSHKSIDKVLSIIYKWFSKSLFGYKLRYVSVLGDSPWIDVIYARNPSKVSAQGKKVIKINFKSSIDFSKKKRDKVLIITSPFSEDGVIRANDEIAFYSSVIQKSLQSFSEVDIKCYPREAIEKYQNVTGKIKFLDASAPAETLDFSEYARIINFGSSVILYLIESGYEASQIDTYIIGRKVRLSDIFNKTNIINL